MSAELGMPNLPEKKNSHVPDRNRSAMLSMRAESPVHRDFVQVHESYERRA